MKPFAAKGFVVLRPFLREMALHLAYTCQMIITMINQDDVPDYVGMRIPEIAGELQREDNMKNVFGSVHVLLDYTLRKIKEQDLLTVKKCFSLAEDLYIEGTGRVKCAIENVFIFSFSQFPNLKTEDMKELMKLIPATLYSIYLGQVLHHGV